MFMRRRRSILALIPVAGFVLLTGFVLDRSTGNAAGPSLTRTSVTQRAVGGRAEVSSSVRKAHNMLARAQGLAAEGKTEDAVGVLNAVVRMELPASREADKLIAEAYKTLGDIYRTDVAGTKAVQFYRLAAQHMSPEQDGDVMAATLKTIAELQNAATPAGSARAATAAPTTQAVFDAGDDNCGQAVGVTLPYQQKMTV